MKRRSKIALLAASIVLGWAGWRGLNVLLYSAAPRTASRAKGEKIMEPKVKKSQEEWKKELSPEAYRMMFQCGTERPFSGPYNDFWEAGTYRCAACGAELFASGTKYEHGTGWPSFTDALHPDELVYLEDHSFGLDRIEVRCAGCGAHLGHVFDDGPAPSGKHYCINSAVLTFVPAPSAAEAAGKAAEKSGPQTETATFAAGCFWGVEYKFGQVPGVLSTAVGYSGGTVKNPTYEEVCTDTTGHAESVRVTFDPSRIGYEELVRKFFGFHDPTQLNRQGLDVGTQYRSVIFTHSEDQRKTAERVRDELVRDKAFMNRIATEIKPVGEFYEAEEYHQKYYQKNKRGACAF
jgi:peptide methionine sulfoxide reductase msrA/msrB